VRPLPIGSSPAPRVKRSANQRFEAAVPTRPKAPVCWSPGNPGTCVNLDRSPGPFWPRSALLLSSDSPRGAVERAVRVDLIPRHGFPHPLRSACAVSHDLGDLPFSRSVRHFSSGHVPGVWGTARVSRWIARGSRGPKTARPAKSPTSSPVPLGARVAGATPASTPSLASQGARLRILRQGNSSIRPGPLPNAFTFD
jgi:hypothetical protein